MALRMANMPTKRSKQATQLSPRAAPSALCHDSQVCRLVFSRFSGRNYFLRCSVVVNGYRMSSACHRRKDTSLLPWLTSMNVIFHESTVVEQPVSAAVVPFMW